MRLDRQTRRRQKPVVPRRRRTAMKLVLLMAALFAVGGLYSSLAPTSRAEEPVATGKVASGEKLFQANCSTCHGIGAAGSEAGPSLIGVGAASVDFQVGTGRMPLQATQPQAPQKQNLYTEQEIADLAAYVASLGAGPGIPSEELTSPNLTDQKVLAEGAELFRVNCAMCHNVVGAGGALTRGKYAPPLRNVTPTHIYEAMQTGPQSMPVFNDTNITPEEKKAVISYLRYVSTEPSPGGITLGSLGPVSEGLFVWVGMLAIIVACTVWLGAKSS